jgi:purine-binding chemotaxis protein CheW
VLADAQIEPVPGAPPAVLGVINLRGRIVTVIDLKRCLGLDGAGAAAAGCSVVVADSGADTLALRVDGIAQVCSVAANAIKPAPAVHGRLPHPLVRGMVRRGETMLTLLDADRLTQEAAAV